jgi:hypothetical protein
VPRKVADERSFQMSFPICVDGLLPFLTVNPSVKIKMNQVDLLRWRCSIQCSLKFLKCPGMYKKQFDFGIARQSLNKRKAC